MQGRSYTSDERALTTLAASHGGYFTSKQAAAIGYTAPKRSYHVHVGNWVRERRGSFDFRRDRLPGRPDLVIWWLWSRNRQDQPQGVYSHQTALSLHEMTDVMPRRLHMTVPRTFRRSVAIPKSIVLHVANLAHSDIEQIDGVPAHQGALHTIDVAPSGRFLYRICNWHLPKLPDPEKSPAQKSRPQGRTQRTETFCECSRAKWESADAWNPNVQFAWPFRQALEERLKTISLQEGTDFQRLCRQVALIAFWLDSSANLPAIGFSNVATQWSSASSPRDRHVTST